MRPLRIALAGLIDYAGLFPPASLELPGVVSNYLTYAGGPHSWLLGRLVVSVTHLGELGTILAGNPALTTRAPISLTVVVKPQDAGPDLASGLSAFSDRFARSPVSIASAELAATTPDDIEGLASQVPASFERYIEVPADERLPVFITRIRAAGCFAKVRTGGIAAAAFPSPSALASFVNRCVSASVPFKATAGLHHPLRGSYRLTYEADSPSSLMHGFVNLIVVTALLSSGQINEGEAAAVLESTDPRAFQISDDAVTWKSHSVTARDLELTRAQSLRAVGSCSFEDAVNDLRRFGWLDER